MERTIHYYCTWPPRILSSTFSFKLSFTMGGHASDRVDVPDRYELFLLDEEKGEKKVTYQLDTRQSLPSLHLPTN
jgi:hypothetical protein